MGSQQQTSNTPQPLRDSWQTPQWLFDWAEERFGEIWFDLAASKGNAKCLHFFSKEDNALSIDWHEELHFTDFNWCNPPYSETGKWLKKGWEEAQNGFRSVFLVPTPNGENGFRDYVLGKASEIIFINGRVGFELPNDDGTATPVSGNTRGSCLIVYNRRYEGQTLMSWVNRDDIKAQFNAAGNE